MTRHEAEKLLGGYATGTLTDQEKSALFSAALDQQELFDALVDEEALRELLADPDARRRLLTLLPEAPVRTAFWDWLRRPAAIGLAASLAGAAVLGVALWQYSGPKKVAMSQVAEVRQTPPPAQPLLKPPEAPQLPVESKAKKTRQASMREEGSIAPLSSAPAVNAPSAPPPAAFPARVAAEKAAPPRQFAADLAIKQSAPQGVVGGIIGGAPAPSPPVPTKRDASNRIVVLGLDSAKQEAVPGAAMKAKSSAPEPSYVLEHLAGDTARLNVKSLSGGNVYVVKRTVAGPGVMLAQRTVVGPTGTTEAVYEFPLSQGDVVDLYILPNPEANPAALTPGGPAGAFVRRVYPESKTIPPVR